ncbi:MAG: hypothetical protein ACFFA7_10565 [Promethearchaeota archaeon]
MVKKGKYKLFSYLVENSLIYYKSTKKKSKIVSFAILECLSYKSIIFILNDLLVRRIIQYYSIQIDTNNKNKTILILNFEENEKEKIIKAFNVVQQNLEKLYISIKYLKEKRLEEKFLDIIFRTISSNTTIKRSSESILISVENKLKALYFYKVDFENIDKKRTFILNFLDFVYNIREKGHLILNFAIDNTENIKISPYFVLESESIEKISTLESKVNNFFHSNVLKKQNIKIKTFANYFWRLGINHIFFYLDDNSDFFNIHSSSDSLDVLEMNKQFEECLKKNHIDYVRLNTNLLFIEDSYIFLILENLDSSIIYKIIEKYHSKYIIYILILNDLGNRELQNIKSIKLIENINILNSSDIRTFNYNELKRNEN